MYLLIHTMTITECDYVLQAQFFHAFGQVQEARLIGKRVSLRMHPNLVGTNVKSNLQRLYAPNLKTMMKRNSGNIKHHLRTIRINSQSTYQHQPQQQNTPDDKNVVTLSSPASSIPITEKIQIEDHNNVFSNDQLVSSSNPQQNAAWLTANRFDKYLQTFASFSGADMFRMTRDDLIQICGHADGIRLYNGLHSKTIAPKLTIYVSRENTSVFNAIFLSSLNNCELLQKLASIIGVPQDQVRDIYIQGPQSIHIQLSNDVIKHIKEETMFHVEILQENGSYIFLLKPSTK